MKSTKLNWDEMVAQVPSEIKTEVNLQFDVSQRVYELMVARGLNKRQLAEQTGHRPSEVTKWLSGQHNFTLRTIAMLTSFFGQPIIFVG